MIRIRIDKALQERLQALSRQSARSRSDLVRQAIRRNLHADDLTTQVRHQSRLASAASEPELAFDDSGWTA